MLLLTVDYVPVACGDDHMIVNKERFEQRDYDYLRSRFYKKGFLLIELEPG